MAIQEVLRSCECDLRPFKETGHAAKRVSETVSETIGFTCIWTTHHLLCGLVRAEPHMHTNLVAFGQYLEVTPLGRSWWPHTGQRNQGTSQANDMPSIESSEVSSAAWICHSASSDVHTC